VLMWATAPGGSARLNFEDATGSNRYVPSDTRFTTFDSSQPQYSAESVGPFKFRPCYFVTAAAGEAVTVYIYEYDAAVDAAVQRLLKGGG